MKRFVFALLTVLLFVAGALAQTSRGTVTGTGSWGHADSRWSERYGRCFG